MENERLNKQVTTVNSAFHKLWRSLIIGRKDLLSGEFGNLSFADMQVIGLAYKKPDLILKEIRDYVRVPQTTLSSIVAKLEKLGFVKRVINRRDMRSFSLEITEPGKHAVEEHIRIDIEQAKMVVMSLDEKERDDFVRLLEKVSERFEQEVVV